MKPGFWLEGILIKRGRVFSLGGQVYLSKVKIMKERTSVGGRVGLQDECVLKKENV